MVMLSEFLNWWSSNKFGIKQFFSISNTKFWLKLPLLLIKMLILIMLLIIHYRGQFSFICHFIMKICIRLIIFHKTTIVVLISASQGWFWLMICFWIITTHHGIIRKLMDFFHSVKSPHISSTTIMGRIWCLSWPHLWWIVRFCLI